MPIVEDNGYKEVMRPKAVKPLSVPIVTETRFKVHSPVHALNDVFGDWDDDLDLGESLGLNSQPMLIPTSTIMTSNSHGSDRSTPNANILFNIKKKNTHFFLSTNFTFRGE